MASLVLDLFVDEQGSSRGENNKDDIQIKDESLQYICVDSLDRILGCKFYM